MTTIHPTCRRPDFAVISLLISLLLGSCTRPGTNVRRVELDRNRALWQSQGMRDYRFLQNKMCFCDPDRTLPMRVEVHDGQVVKAELPAGSRLFPVDYAMTIEQAFERIERAVDSGIQFDVTYDAQLGYPTRMDLNWGMDADFAMVSSELVRLDPPDPCAPPITSTACDCAAEYPAVAYRYAAWDDVGRHVAEGCATLTFTYVIPMASSGYPHYAVAGDRCVDVGCDTLSTGPHHGSSRVAGLLNSLGYLSIDMNAGSADNNIVLSAKVYGDRPTFIFGDWSRNTIAGPTARGMFLLEEVERAP